MIESILNIHLEQPLGYYEMLSLINRSDLVLTNSGGVQKETFWLAVPCITLREKTEWMETVELGANVVTGLSANNIKRAVGSSDHSQMRALDLPVCQILMEMEKPQSKLSSPFGNS